MGYNKFPNFSHDANELSAFLLTLDTFILSLKDGRIIHFKPDNVDVFKEWLIKHKVRDCRTDISILQARYIAVNSKYKGNNFLSVKWINSIWLRYFKRK